ncbi:hypothetical protein DICSQDRAFT_174058 [Dichomitus squalens LYAD-421 SS1]|uniref:Protein kinase domain-containing protein n=1 Tax=Dichomitus squalens (strain LYAD-421) TaxID=732165 RepID=R7SNK1_DICSQ|nr:uncharacterized protein DICSQDRAFT_174058 [Dichomitus squalens LYAD-421 SS1]EJF57295.1 hypothetical protein DICSQDRAFT_174058 [Dichomitus squalens LYAD-421 SS1]
MSDDDYIFFYPHPDIRNNDIVVNAPSTSRLQHLWDRAKSQEPSIASHIGTAQCTLYVLSDLPTEPDATLFSRSRECLRLHCHDEDKVATRFRQVSKFFPDGPSPDMVHFLSSRKTSLDQLGTIQDQVLRGMRKVVVDNADKFHAGRPAGNYGPPACLFNHALGLVDYRLRHLDDDISEPAPPPILMRMVHQLMTTAARSCSSEDDRVGAMKTLLGKIFSKALHWKPPQGTYGIVPHAINADDPPFVVVEVKNEAGLEGDASLQAGLSYAHIVTAPQFKALRRQSNYPAILCGFMGNLLEISVAIYTDGMYCDLLFSERLHLGFHSAKNVLRLSRALTATRKAIADLTAFYAQLKAVPGAPPQASIAHLFPSPLKIPSYTGFVPSLTFTHRLTRSGEAVLLAASEETTAPSSPRDTHTDSVEVVVKLTERYHPEAHRILAAEHLAPALHVCVPVCGDLFMVVMERVHGEMAWEAANRQELLPYRIYQDIKRAIALLHSHDLVFGDLRTPNTMVVPGGSGLDDGPRGMLVDFDWVGTHGRGRYPASLDEGLPDWATSSIQRDGIMDKAHDVAMLGQFKEQCHQA